MSADVKAETRGLLRRASGGRCLSTDAGMRGGSSQHTCRPMLPYATLRSPTVTAESDSSLEEAGREPSDLLEPE